MSGTYVVSGSVTEKSCCSSGCGAPKSVFSQPWCATVATDAETSGRFTLTDDAPFSLPFGMVTSAHVLQIVTNNLHIEVTVTSADGTAQVLPCDPVLVAVSRSTPFTAVTLTRDAGIDTIVEVFLGHQAA